MSTSTSYHQVTNITTKYDTLDVQGRPVNTIELMIEHGGTTSNIAIFSDEPLKLRPKEDSLYDLDPYGEGYYDDTGEY